MLVIPFRTEYDAPTFRMNGGEVYTVKAVGEKWMDNGNSAMTIIPTLFVFTEDIDAFTARDREVMKSNRDPALRFEWMYDFDLNVPAEKQVEIAGRIRETDWARGLEYAEVISSVVLNSQEGERTGFFTLFGGLFFIGIVLSIVFLMAAVLIIYFKQISEGYEDRSRFEIMQKVGMTRKDIRRSINSQMLTVFYLPLVMAGVHLSFAFPIIRKILMLFNLRDTALLIVVTAICFVIFALFYAVVYKITSNAYFSIVSGAKENDT